MRPLDGCPLASVVANGHARLVLNGYVSPIPTPTTPTPPRTRSRAVCEACSREHVLGGAAVSRVRPSGRGLYDLFAQDVAVTRVPGEFFDHGEQGPSHAHCSFAGIVLGVVEVEAGGDRA